MIKDNFTNIDKQIFDSIFRVTETIERLYEGLYNLEIKGLKIVRNIIENLIC